MVTVLCPTWALHLPSVTGVGHRAVLTPVGDTRHGPRYMAGLASTLLSRVDSVPWTTAAWTERVTHRRCPAGSPRCALLLPTGLQARTRHIH